MKTKIQVLAMMFIAAMAFGACDDDDKNDNIKELPMPCRRPLRINILLPWTLNGNGKAIIS